MNIAVMVQGNINLLRARIEQNKALLATCPLTELIEIRARMDADHTAVLYLDGVYKMLPKEIA